MNIFRYQGQEEDHYTNILMNILAYQECQPVGPFLSGIIPNHEALDISECFISIRSKHCPQPQRSYEYIIAVAPYKNTVDEHSKLEDNLSSIPDAWICGRNFNILIEFKIRGTLDEAQMAAHQKLLGSDATILRLQWQDILGALSRCKNNDDPILNYLIDHFVEVVDNFKMKRKASGMPAQVISNTNNERGVHFVITGSRKEGVYTVDLVEYGTKTRLHDSLKGIQASRRWIASYVRENQQTLDLPYNDDETIISDYCVVPGRPEKKNQWNQWRLGSL